MYMLQLCDSSTNIRMYISGEVSCLQASLTFEISDLNQKKK